MILTICLELRLLHNLDSQGLMKCYLWSPESELLLTLDKSVDPWTQWIRISGRRSPGICMSKKSPFDHPVAEFQEQEQMQAVSRGPDLKLKSWWFCHSPLAKRSHKMAQIQEQGAYFLSLDGRSCEVTLQKVGGRYLVVIFVLYCRWWAWWLLLIHLL